MASRDISGALLRTCFGAVRKEATPSRLLKEILESIAYYQRDLDKTGDMDSAAYYTGAIDALKDVAYAIAPLKADKTDMFYGLLDLVADTKKEEAA